MIVVLLGPPGCGKTELAKALMASLGITLYEITYADDDGDPIDGEQRTAAAWRLVLRRQSESLEPGAQVYLGR